jgi:hypothetical protein
MQEFDVLMESKGGKKSSSSRSMMYEAPLGYSIEDVRPAGGVKKFQSAAYSNVKINHHNGALYSTSCVLLDMLIVTSIFSCCSARRSHPDIPFGFLILVV